MYMYIVHVPYMYSNLVLTIYCFILLTSDVLDVLLGFFLTLFDSLLSEMDHVLCERITQTFMTLLTRCHAHNHAHSLLMHTPSHRQHLEEAILQEDGAGACVVEK